VVLVTSGGIGANHDRGPRELAARLGPAPRRMISGVPEHVDGRMLAIVARAGGRIVNPDRIGHYTEDRELAADWPGTASGFLPGPVLAVARRPGRRFPPRIPGLRHPGHLKAISDSGWTTTPGS